MRDDEIDLSEIPRLDEKFFAEAILVPGKNKKRKKQVTLHLDSDIVAFFLKRGPECQTAINAVLRGYIQSEKMHARKRRSSHAAD
ncbi:MAG TPA: BrnA antitoxin family protein [Terriglobales bacterium]|nr:BrnA antitoxin family protein [Terriglobales bacterium]